MFNQSIIIDFISADPHCHDASTMGGIDKRARNKLLKAFILCIVFMIGEFVGGFLANSLAIMTDAFHLLSDFAAFLISLLAIYLAAQPSSANYSFGFHRLEVMGAIVSILVNLITFYFNIILFTNIINIHLKL